MNCFKNERNTLLKASDNNLSLGARIAMCEEILSFIGSLQEEPVSEELEDAAIQYAGKHAPYDDAMDEVEEAFKAGAQWGKNQTMAEIQSQSISFAHGCPEKEPVSEDLEQAIDNYLATYWGGEKEKQDWPFLKKMAIHFANWQREQIIKNSIEVKVKSDKDGFYTTETWDEMNELLQKIGAKEGDKVHISIIKQEEE